MDLDPDNPVFKLCIEGMQAEFQGRHLDAKNLFEQAWQLHRDDLEACVAAHYLARQQDNPQAVLEWNTRSLQHARQSSADLSGFMPSLYLNMGWSYEQLGDLAAAGSWYRQAGEVLEALPSGGYRQTVEQGIRNGLQRLQAAQQNGGAHS